MMGMTNYEDDVKILKEWYSKQYHLPQKIDDRFFYNFVSGTNSIEKAKRKMDAYFTMRHYVMDMMKSVYPTTETYRKALPAHHIAIHPDKTPEGYRVMFSAVNSSHASLANADCFFFRKILMVEIAYEMWPTDMEYIVFEDYGHLPLESLKTIDLKHCAVMGKFFSKAIPFKMKADYMINMPNFLDKIQRVLRQLISKKMDSRVFIAKDHSKMKEILPINMVPKEYGGQGKSLKEISDNWIDIVDSKQSWFEENLKLCTDESKRPKDSFARETLDFGLEGSFKTLNID